MEVGVIGLGKMGKNIALHLLEHEYNVVGYDIEESNIKSLEQDRFKPAYTLKSLAEQIKPRRIVFLSLPASPELDVVDETLDNIIPYLYEKDIVIDGGNSHFKKASERYSRLKSHGIHFLDAGCSGGPDGARNGMAIMVGGDKEVFEYSENIFKDLSWNHEGYAHLGRSGAGHFVKMIHNGIEYGMMQAIVEGFELLAKGSYQFDLKEVAGLYNKGSVIQSRLLDWLQRAFEQHGQELQEVSGKVAHSGEGQWTVETARELGLYLPAIETALQFRIDSQKTPSYMGQMLSGMRNAFGGHEVYKK